MRTKQNEFEPSFVVSVRLSRTEMERLEGLCERTGRSRGFFLRAALTYAMPALEEEFWEQVVPHRAREEDVAFAQLVRELMRPSSDDGGTSTPC